jgi:hypothetical protein
MRRKIVFGLGLVGVLSSTATAQFASERAPAIPATPPAAAVPGGPSSPPPLPDGVRPIGGAPIGKYVPPATGGIPGVTPGLPAEPPAPPPPRDLTIYSALGADHPWVVKPEHGPFFLCVKSYSRPSKPDDGGMTARELAELLATDIRDLYRVQAFLYEYVSEERKAEIAAIAAARERGRIFANQLDKYKQEAQLKGMDFMSPDNKIHFKTVKYNDQIAVLVGGFKTEKDAREALDTMRKWPSPKNKVLMDGAVIARPNKDGKMMMEQGYINPYLTSHVVPNPSIAKAAANAPDTGLDPFVVKLNEDNPYNLLNATKGWTLAVKSFSAPVQIVGRDGDGAAMMRKVGTSDKGKKILVAGAEQAESMAKALRALRGPGTTAQPGAPLNLEVFVLHTRSGSIVTIGQFDGPTDPALVQTKQLLQNLPLKVTQDKFGSQPVPNAPTLFEKLIAIPIPRP